MVQLRESILWILSVIGCYLQLNTTLSTYFNYQTITETRSFTPHILAEPDLSLCIRYVDIVGVKPEDAYNHNLTLKQIFERSYPTGKLIDECYVRLRKTRLVSNFRNATCLNYFSVKKYFTQEYICYHIIPIHQHLPSQSYAQSLWYPGTVYWIYLKEDLARKIVFIKPFVHSHGLPMISSMFSRYFHKRSANESSFSIEHATNHYKHLGYPYDEFKCGYPGEHAECKANCTTSLSVQAFGKLLYDVMFVDPLNYQILSGRDMKVEGTVEKVEKIHEICNSKCNVRDCDGNYTLSTVAVSMRDRFVIKVLSPECPDTKKISVQRVSFLDLVVYVMSALGTWFGFVVIDIDPMKYVFELSNLHKRLRQYHDRRKKKKFSGNQIRNRTNYSYVPPSMILEYVRYRRRRVRDYQTPCFVRRVNHY